MKLKKGEKRITRYPDEYALLGIKTMAAYNVPCSVMPRLMETHCKSWSNADLTDVKFGTAHLFKDFRFSVPFLCMVQVGYLLTKHAKKVMTHQQDGTPLDTPRGRHHVETFVISAKDITIRSLPWVQTDKKGATSHRCFRNMMQRCQCAYGTFYKFCKQHRAAEGLIDPKPLGSILSSIKVRVRVGYF